MTNIPGEYLVSFSLLGMGVMTLVSSRCEWYWEFIRSSYWHRCDTPLYRFMTVFISIFAIVYGLGGFLGWIKFSSR